ncbi:MAG: hypothetical protein K2P58_15675 [Hyphomonadaceae bacterium]|nr:hypothetical protein [Hyphomonadaceae bacterium]
MSGEMALRFATQAQLDIRRITGELAELHKKISTGAEADDLKGFGGASASILSARTLRADAEAKASIMTQVETRLGVQAAALGRASDAARSLAQRIREAIAAGDGRGVAIELDLAFNDVVSALNESWNGQPLFAGERQSASGPIRVSTLDELLTATTPDALYNEADRNQVLDLGRGAPVLISPKASEFSQGLFDAMRGLKQMLVDNGGTVGRPIGAAQENSLLYFVATLDAQAARITDEEGRIGALQKRAEKDLLRLQERADLLTKEIGNNADADLAEVSIRLSSLMAQYEASAKTFVDLSRLTLLNFLR